MKNQKNSSGFLTGWPTQYENISDGDKSQTDIHRDSFFSNLPVGFFRCDMEGKLLHVNKAFLRITEATKEEDVTGHSLGSFYSDHELFVSHFRLLQDEGMASFGRTDLQTSLGSYIVCRVSAFVIRNDSGIPVYIDGAIEDLTREADLEKKLLNARKLDSIGLLAGGIAHDFNTILTTIYGYSELALEGLDPAGETYQNIKKIIQAAGRAKALTGQILTFSRQAGQLRVTVPVAEILNETVGFLRPAVKEGIILREEILTPGVCVSADPTQLFRVFINLATNALQAMETTGGSLTVTLDTRKGSEIGTITAGRKVADEYVLIRFADTGTGMDENTAGRIFEPFFTTGKNEKGTGLGLSVVYGIISEIDGEITVSGKKGNGTVIEVLIPSVSSTLPETGESDRGTHILLIPGDDSEVRVISLALSKSGYTVGSADADADWLAKSGNTDVIVVFDKSPGKQATDILFSMIRAGVTKPVLLISDFDIWLNSEKELPSGIVKASLFKPVSLKEIIYSIDALTKKQS